MKYEKVISFCLLTLVLISIIGIILLFVQNKNISSLINHEKTPKIGEKAFTFKKTDLSGREINIRGKNTLLIFFNTRCPKCRTSSQEWNNFYKSNNSTQINIVGISSENSEITKRYIKKFKIIFSVISDPNHEILWQYKVKYVPLLVLVNKDGLILYYKEYAKSLEEAFKEICNIIKT